MVRRVTVGWVLGLVAAGLATQVWAAGGPAYLPPKAGRDPDRAPAVRAAAQRGQSPLLRVARRDQTTSRWQEDRTFHQRWVWNFGDGTVEIDPIPRNTSGVKVHVYRRPGLYRVSATSWSNKGTLLRRQTWTELILPPPVPPQGQAAARFIPQPRLFYYQTIEEPRLDWSLQGPAKWLTGKPSSWQVPLTVKKPPFSERMAVDVDPGRQFQVLWERAGRHTVKAAVAVDITYRLPEGNRVRIRNVYTRARPVEVLTTAITD